MSQHKIYSSTIQNSKHKMISRQSSKKPLNFNDIYNVGEQIGKGAYAVVFKCTHRTDLTEWAVKVIDKSKAGPKDIDDTKHEIRIMQKIGKHPHVVGIKEYFETGNHLFLVLDLLQGGMLFDRIVSLKHYSEQVASKLIKNFLLALEHIHTKGVIHRDLKPENLLLKSKSSSNKTDTSHLTECVLADFGLAGYPPGQTCCGSPSYIAPEVIDVGYFRTTREPYGSKCDVWSLGVITFILLSGKMPFYGRNFKETFQRISAGKWAFAEDIWTSVSDQAKDFIKLMLTLDPIKRPNATQALKHPWISKVQSDIHLMDSMVNLRTLTAENKIKAAMIAFRATTSLLGKLDKTPPFMKYLTHTDKLSTVIESKSQTNSDITHQIDYSIILTNLQKTNLFIQKSAGKPEYKLGIIPKEDAVILKLDDISIQQCCTCESKLICRHIQNIHEYLFIGSKAYDVEPFMNELQTMRAEVDIDLADNPHDKGLLQKLERIEFIIASTRIFALRYSMIQTKELKPNLLLSSATTSPGQIKNKLLTNIKDMKL